MAAPASDGSAKRQYNGGSDWGCHVGASIGERAGAGVLTGRGRIGVRDSR
jgi:hypothetical protein